MKALFILLIAGQSHVNSELAKKIDAMFVEDQRWRKEALKISKGEKSDYDEESLNLFWAKADSLNELKAKQIVNQYGYPGYDMVGQKGSGEFWAIVQHCDDDVQFQEKVIALMEKEIEKNNAAKDNYAYLVDRVLVSKNQKQIYGTQCHLNQNNHHWEPFPIKDPANVDTLRKSMGLGPLADYVKSMNQ